MLDFVRGVEQHLGEPHAPILFPLQPAHFLRRDRVGERRGEKGRGGRRERQGRVKERREREGGWWGGWGLMTRW